MKNWKYKAVLVVSSLVLLVFLGRKRIGIFSQDEVCLEMSLERKETIGLQEGTMRETHVYESIEPEDGQAGKPARGLDVDPPYTDEEIIKIAQSICKQDPRKISKERLRNETIIMREGDLIRVLFPKTSAWKMIRGYELEAVIDSETGIVLNAWRFHSATNAASDEGWSANISDESAISLATQRIDGELVYEKNLTIRVEHLEGGVIRVVFPGGSFRADTGNFYPGPDFSAEVLIDAGSGKILRVSSGS